MIQFPQPRGASEPSPGEPQVQRAFSHRVAVVIMAVVAVTVLMVFLWQAAYVLLLVFAGNLFAIFLRSLSDALSRLTHISEGWSLTVVIVSLLAVVIVSCVVLAPRIAEQADQLQDALPQAFDQIIASMEQTAWGSILVEEFRQWTTLEQTRPVVAAQAMNVVTISGVALGVLLLVLFVGIYLAINPAVYFNGLVHLLPPASRPRTRQVLQGVGYALKWWLIGRLIAMAAVGVLTSIGLWILGVPLALTLGILAAILDFVPNVGPIVASIPAVLLAFVIDPWLALYVIALYFIVQQIESYVITPLVQERVVKIPPAVTIVAQVLFFVLVGPLGLLLATPLTVAAMEIIKGVYLQDVLKDPQVQLLVNEREAEETQPQPRKRPRTRHRRR